MGKWDGKFDPKQKIKNLLMSSEILHDNQENHFIEKPKKKLGGILKIGQSVNIDNTEKKPTSVWNKEFLGNFNYIQQEEKLSLEQSQQELKKDINRLRRDIKQISASLPDTPHDIKQAEMEEYEEVSVYHESWLEQIKNLVQDFSANFSNSDVWLESFNSKKKKRNAFWNNFKNKKSGGEQYLSSNEHSPARSAA